MSELPAGGRLSAFVGHQLLGSGLQLDLIELLRTQDPKQTPVLVFEDATGRQIDLDLRQTSSPVEDLSINNMEAPATRGRGRPKLGVKGREVTLLPRHWQWLEQQRGGASATLRRLVEQARKDSAVEDGRRAAQSRCNRVLTALAGDFKNYEEATRHLFAGDEQRFLACIKAWPLDIRVYIERMAAGAFE